MPFLGCHLSVSGGFEKMGRDALSIGAGSSLSLNAASVNGGNFAATASGAAADVNVGSGGYIALRGDGQIGNISGDGTLQAQNGTVKAGDVSVGAFNFTSGAEVTASSLSSSGASTVADSTATVLRDLTLNDATLQNSRLLVGGMNKVFELGKDFRNEGIDRTHNPEFTVCEIYEAYGDRTSMEAIMEGLLPHLCDKVIGTRKVEYGEKKEIIDFNPPYRRVAYKDLVKELMGDDWFELDFAAQLEKAKAKGRETDTNLELDGITRELELTHEVYDKLIEKKLMQPTFVTRIPHEFVPLAKACKDDPSLVDVFEFVVAGRELCPGYTEQNDPLEQRKALENQAGEDTEKIDEDFISALECGMPPTGGLGFGVDRLVMFLTGTDSIRDVVLFPQMKTTA